MGYSLNSMDSSSTFDDTPSRCELIDLVRMQDDIIDELLMKLESLTMESEGENKETIPNRLLVEMRNKLAESVTLTEELQRKNSSLSSQLQKLQHTSETAPSMTCLELYGLLEKERDYAFGLRKWMTELETLKQQQLERIKELEFQVSNYQNGINEARTEAQDRIGQLLNELAERQRRFDEVKTLAASTETRCIYLEENCNTKINLAEMHCDQLRTEVSRLMKSKSFLTERVAELTDELARWRLKILETPLSVLTVQDGYQCIIDEQKRVIDDLTDENVELKKKLNKVLNRKVQSERHSSRQKIEHNLLKL